MSLTKLQDQYQLYFYILSIENSENEIKKTLHQKIKHNNVNVLNATDICTLKMVKMINFILYVFYYNKERKIFRDIFKKCKIHTLKTTKNH